MTHCKKGDPDMNKPIIRIIALIVLQSFILTQITWAIPDTNLKVVRDAEQEDADKFPPLGVGGYSLPKTGDQDPLRELLKAGRKALDSGILVDAASPTGQATMATFRHSFMRGQIIDFLSTRPNQTAGLDEINTAIWGPLRGASLSTKPTDQRKAETERDVWDTLEILLKAEQVTAEGTTYTLVATDDMAGTIGVAGSRGSELLDELFENAKITVPGRETEAATRDLKLVATIIPRAGSADERRDVRISISPANASRLRTDIPYATVGLFSDRLEKTCELDQDGNAKLENVPPGVYTLRVIAPAPVFAIAPGDSEPTWQPWPPSFLKSRSSATGDAAGIALAGGKDAGAANTAGKWLAAALLVVGLAAVTNVKENAFIRRATKNALREETDKQAEAKFKELQRTLEATDKKRAKELEEAAAKARRENWVTIFNIQGKLMGAVPAKDLALINITESGKDIVIPQSVAGFLRKNGIEPYSETGMAICAIAQREVVKNANMRLSQRQGAKRPAKPKPKPKKKVEAPSLMDDKAIQASMARTDKLVKEKEGLEQQVRKQKNQLSLTVNPSGQITGLSVPPALKKLPTPWQTVHFFITANPNNRGTAATFELRDDVPDRSIPLTPSADGSITLRTTVSLHPSTGDLKQEVLTFTNVVDAESIERDPKTDAVRLKTPVIITGDGKVTPARSTGTTGVADAKGRVAALIAAAAAITGVPGLNTSAAVQAPADLNPRRMAVEVSGRNAIEPLIRMHQRALNIEEKTNQAMALAGLQKALEISPQALVRLLGEDTDADFRIAVLNAIGALGTELLAVQAAIDRLIEIAKDGSDGRLQTAAIVTLGDLGPGAEAAINTLLNLVGNSAQHIAGAAAVALGKIATGDDARKAAEALRQLAVGGGRSNIDILARKDAIDGLRELGAPYATATLCGLLRNIHPLDVDAATALGELGDPFALPALRLAAKDAEELTDAAMQAATKNAITQIEASVSRATGDVTGGVANMAGDIAMGELPQQLSFRLSEAVVKEIVERVTAKETLFGFGHHAITIYLNGAQLSEAIQHMQYDGDRTEDDCRRILTQAYQLAKDATATGDAAEDAAFLQGLPLSQGVFAKVSELQESDPGTAERFVQLQRDALENWQYVLDNWEKTFGAPDSSKPSIVIVVPTYGADVGRLRDQDSIVPKLRQLKFLAEADKTSSINFGLYVVDDKPAEDDPDKSVAGFVRESELSFNEKWGGHSRVSATSLSLEKAIQDGSAPELTKWLTSSTKSIKWGSLIYGMAQAYKDGAKIVVMTDSDTNQQLFEMANGIRRIMDDKLAAVIMSRFIKGSASNNKEIGLHNFLEFYYYNQFAQALMPELVSAMPDGTPIQDLQSGLKVYRADDGFYQALLNMHTRGLGGDAEFLAWLVRNGGNIAEHPRTEIEESPGKSSIKFGGYGKFVEQQEAHLRLRYGDAYEIPRAAAVIRGEIERLLDESAWGLTTHPLAVGKERLSRALTDVQSGNMERHQIEDQLNREKIIRVFHNSALAAATGAAGIGNAAAQEDIIETLRGRAQRAERVLELISNPEMTIPGAQFHAQELAIPVSLPPGNSRDAERRSYLGKLHLYANAIERDSKAATTVEDVRKHVRLYLLKVSTLAKEITELQQRRSRLAEMTMVEELTAEFAEIDAALREAVDQNLALYRAAHEAEREASEDEAIIAGTMHREMLNKARADVEIARIALLAAEAVEAAAENNARAVRAPAIGVNSLLISL